MDANLKEISHDLEANEAKADARLEDEGLC
jgi:hypothetical protein